MVAIFLQLSTYWWKGMANDVSECCKPCDTCQRVNNRLEAEELHPIPVTDVWKQIGMDLISMFQMIWMIV